MGRLKRRMGQAMGAVGSKCRKIGHIHPEPMRIAKLGYNANVGN